MTKTAIHYKYKYVVNDQSYTARGMIVIKNFNGTSLHAQTEFSKYYPNEEAPFSLRYRDKTTRKFVELL